MAIGKILKKMFSTEGYRERLDEYGEPIKKKTIEEKLLDHHLEMERKKKIRRALEYYDKKHYKEMTSMRMPYHNKFRRK